MSIKSTRPPPPRRLPCRLPLPSINGLGFHDRWIPTPETLHEMIKESQSRDEVPGSLEMKETHRPWEGRMLPGLALPEELRVWDFIIDQSPPNPETLHAILKD